MASGLCGQVVDVFFRQRGVDFGVFGPVSRMNAFGDYKFLRGVDCDITALL